MYLDFKYFKDQEIIGAIGCPNFSLNPLNKEDLIDKKKLSLVKVYTPKLNWFSCLDDETITETDFMAGKFRLKREWSYKESYYFNV